MVNSVANLWRILPAKRLRFPEVFGLMFTSLLLNKLEVFLLSLKHGNQSNSTNLAFKRTPVKRGFTRATNFEQINLRGWLRRDRAAGF